MSDDHPKKKTKMKAKTLRVVGLLVLFYAYAVPTAAQTDQATRLELADSSRCA